MQTYSLLFKNGNSTNTTKRTSQKPTYFESIVIAKLDAMFGEYGLTFSPGTLYDSVECVIEAEYAADLDMINKIFNRFVPAYDPYNYKALAEKKYILEQLAKNITIENDIDFENSSELGEINVELIVNDKSADDIPDTNKRSNSNQLIPAVVSLAIDGRINVPVNINRKMTKDFIKDMAKLEFTTADLDLNKIDIIGVVPVNCESNDGSIAFDF